MDYVIPGTVDERCLARLLARASAAGWPRPKHVYADRFILLEGSEVEGVYASPVGPVVLHGEKTWYRRTHLSKLLERVALAGGGGLWMISRPSGGGEVKVLRGDFG